ncbi:MAG: PBSX family phage terminase large subunit, partial [Clostridia bacterium]|nr:PBSX family phage terminase large subunit [Clostridia bacterium]
FCAKSAPEIAFASLGVDFGGNRSATSFVLTGISKDFKSVTVLDEFYTKRVLSPKELEECFVSFLKKHLGTVPVYDAWCDSAESTLIRGLENAALAAKLPVTVRPALKKPILDRIRFFCSLMSYGRFFYRPHCVHVKDALSSAVWDDGAAADVRLDDGSVNVDSLDALEYSTEYYMNDFLDLR